MNDPDLSGLEADLQKLKPAEPPLAFMDRLVIAAQSAAPPGHAESASPPTCPPRPTLLELCGSLLRWLLPAAAAAGMGLFLGSRLASPSPTPADPQASQAPLRADNVHLTRQYIGTFDAVAEMPGGELVRFRCQEWADQMTLRDAARGIEVVHSAPRFDVVPVRFETY